jgi:hypothetical protein
VMMIKSNQATYMCFLLGKLSRSYGYSYAHLLLFNLVSLWNFSVVGCQDILSHGLCWNSYLNLLWIIVMVAI